MGLATNPNAASLTGATTALFYVGGIFGCLLNSWMADRFGRKITVATACALQLIASACLAGSVNIAMFIVFRFVNGLGYVSPTTWLRRHMEVADHSLQGLYAVSNGSYVDGRAGTSEEQKHSRWYQRPFWSCGIYSRCICTTIPPFQEYGVRLC